MKDVKEKPIWELFGTKEFQAEHWRRTEFLLKALFVFSVVYWGFVFIAVQIGLIKLA